MLAWGDGYLREIESGRSEGEGEASSAREVVPLLTSLKNHYLHLLQAQVKREVETYEDTVVLTPSTHEGGLSGFSELIFRARKEAEEGAKFRLTLDFEAVPVAAPANEGSGDELRLMSVATTEELVNEGSSLVIVALVGVDMHIRIFDANGKMVVDKPAFELRSGQELTDLKGLLNSFSFSDDSTLSPEQTEQTIKSAQSCAGYTQRKGPPVPVHPIHLKRIFQTSYVKIDDIRKLIDGSAASLREEVNAGDFKGQDSQSLTKWFTDSFVPWLQSEDIVLVAN